MDIHWIKLKTKMFDDEKIQLIEAMPESDAILIIWIKLLIQAGKINSNGYIFLNENVPFTEEMLSTIFKRPLQVVRFALKTLRDFELIEVDNKGFLSIMNWEKHQNVIGLDEIREKNRIRKQKERLRKKELACHVTVAGRHALDTDTDTDTEIEKDIKTYCLSEEKELFNFWNSQEIIIHQDKIFKSVQSVLKTKLKTYTLEEIKKSIRHYNFILKSDQFYWSHKWTLKEFLNRGLEKFMIDLEILKENYKVKNGTHSKSNAATADDLAEIVTRNYNRHK